MILTNASLTLNPILIAAAIIPAVTLLVRVYKADRLDREPTGLLLSLVLFGVLSTFIAVVLEVVGGMILSSFLSEDTLLFNLIEYFVVVACSEECAKYVLLKLRTWRSPHFNCQFDGVVYAVFVSLGFALWENVGYVIQNGWATAVVRALTAVPGHACFGVFMGVFYGAAKRYDGMQKPLLSKRCRRLSLLFPILMHGAYDFIATMSATGSGWFFVVFIVIMFIIGLRIIKNAARTDRYITEPTDPDVPDIPMQF